MEQLKRFDYVFHVALKHVKPEDTVEELIVKQHKLGGHGVTTQEILSILTEQKVKRQWDMLSHSSGDSIQFQYLDQGKGV